MYELHFSVDVIGSPMTDALVMKPAFRYCLEQASEWEIELEVLKPLFKDGGPPFVFDKIERHGIRSDGRDVRPDPKAYLLPLGDFGLEIKDANGRTIDHRSLRVTGTVKLTVADSLKGGTKVHALPVNATRGRWRYD